MKLELKTQGLTAAAGLRAQVEERLDAALGRLAHRVSGLRVRLADVNGPRGGIDIQCHIEAAMPRHGVLRARSTAASVQAALADASRRLAHTLSRRVGRLAQRRRGRR